MAIVILNYNGSHFLKQFLPGVIKNSQGYEVIVADNASTDDSLEVLSVKFAGVRVIALPQNYGFAGGYNEALAQVTADYYILLNSDVAVSPGWVEPLVYLLASEHDIAAVQPKILAYHDQAYFEYAGAGGGMLDYLGYPFCRGRLFEHLEPDSGQYDDVAPIFWATGACLCIRASCYHEAGGLDADYFAHMEEIDLCWRLQWLGYRVAYHGGSRVYHVGGGTLNKSNPRKTYLNFRNSLWTLYKNSKQQGLYRRIFMRMCLDGLAAWKFLLTGGPRHFFAVLRAHYDFYSNFNHLRAKRKAIFKDRKVDVIDSLYPHSIVWQYFAKGKKSYQHLGD